MDENSRALLCTLQFGPKQRHEILDLTHLGESAVDTTTDTLVEKNAIIRDTSGEGTKYHLEDVPEIVQPKPPADDEEVLEELLSIANCVEYFTSRNVMDHDDRLLFDSHVFPPLETLLPSSSRFLEIAEHRYFVLNHIDNRELFFDILDALLDNRRLAASPIEIIEENRNLSLMSSNDGSSNDLTEADVNLKRKYNMMGSSILSLHIQTAYISLMGALVQLIDNLRAGKEAEELRTNILDREDKFLRFARHQDIQDKEANPMESDNILQTESDIGYAAVKRKTGEILRKFSDDMYKNYLLTRIEYDFIDLRDMAADLFEVYQQNHEMPEMKKELDDLERELSGWRAERVSELKETVKLLYTVEMSSEQGVPLGELLDE